MECKNKEGLNNDVFKCKLLTNWYYILSNQVRTNWIRTNHVYLCKIEYALIICGFTFDLIKWINANYALIDCALKYQNNSFLQIRKVIASQFSWGIQTYVTFASLSLQVWKVCHQKFLVSGAEKKSFSSPLHLSPLLLLLPFFLGTTLRKKNAG